jgi:hypothetical protein
MSSALPDRDGEDRTGKLTNDEVIEALIADCNGDARAAAMALLKLNQYLTSENKRLALGTSPGFLRGSGGHRR